MDESKYCSGCGKTLEPGMQFCPQCGKVVSGSAADQEIQEQSKEFMAVLLESKRVWLMFFLAVYAIPALISAIFTLVDASNLAASVWASDEFQKWLSNHGFHYTESDIQNYITYAGGMALASSICAGVSLFCVYMRKYWIVAVAACILAAILCFWSIFGMIIGFIVAWMIIGARELFVDQPKAEED